MMPLEGKRQHYSTRLSHPPARATSTTTRLSYSLGNDTYPLDVMPTITISSYSDHAATAHSNDESLPAHMRSTSSTDGAAAIAIPTPSSSRSIYDEQIMSQPKMISHQHHTIDTLYDSSKVIQASLIVGVVRSLIGFTYSKLLNASVNGIWKWLPNALLASSQDGTFNSITFITGISTLGGLIMGLLSSKFRSRSFTLADLIYSFSGSDGANIEDLPLSSSRHALQGGASSGDDRMTSVVSSLLIQSLVTCAFGFSVGPEAPIICMGALVGAQMGKNWFATTATTSSTPSYSSTEQAYNLSATSLTTEQRKVSEILAYAGAAGAWTALMGMPIIGAIFVLELTRNSASLSNSAKEALSPAMAATLASLALLKLILAPDSAIGGTLHFGRSLLYGGGTIRGATVIITSVSTGLFGDMIGTLLRMHFDSKTLPSNLGLSRCLNYFSVC